MPSQGELRNIAVERLKDARALLRAGRYDGAIYLAGYVVELSLKARICQTLKWSKFPETNREWEPVKSLKTHDFEAPLLFSGVEDKIRTRFFTEWSVVKNWSPERRYGLPGVANRSAADDMIAATAILRKVL